MTEPGPDRCEVCGAEPLERVLHPVAVHYKGSGFYSTDYGKGGRKRRTATAATRPRRTAAPRPTALVAVQARASRRRSKKVKETRKERAAAAAETA